MKSLLLLSLLIVPSIKEVTVSTEIHDAYDLEHIISHDEVNVIATDLATGTEYQAERDGSLTLPEGAYHVTGEGNWCFLVPQDVIITEKTSTLSLEAGCE